MTKKYFIFISLLFLLSLTTMAQIAFNFQSNYSYLKGSSAVNISSSWMTKSFNASTWSKGNAPFRYGDGTGGTELSDMQNNYSTFYLRTTFTAKNLSQFSKVSFYINYDDGFILWINGKQVIERFSPAAPAYNSFSTELNESGSPENIEMSTNSLGLIEGENLISVQVFNYNLESSDVYFDLQIGASIPVPEEPTTSDSIKVLFSHLGGFYNDPFTLTLTTPDSKYDILYTIDGSNPQNSKTAQNGGKSKTLTINPTSKTGRPATPVYIVRASIKESGLKASLPLTQSYIFVEQVVKQEHPGGGWPTDNVNGQVLDFEMDKDVTQSAAYKNDIDDALLAIPSISVVTDLDNLFGPQNGIYVNALQHGIDWERLCAVELLNPNGEKGFNTNAGLRIRGGWSRHNNYSKHAFRLFFRKEYGAAKLKFPLFGDEGVDEFDKVDLRTAQNYAWSNNQDHNTFVREVFSRDTQRDMGHPYTRSRYYHLYLNGMYWGLFQTQERSEADYAVSYFGGQNEDYDVIKVNGDYSYSVEATDGNTDKWEEVWNYCQAGFKTNKQYFALEGKDSKGVPIIGAEIKVDIDNLIDYMIIIFYTGNFDSPVSKFGGDGKPNNYYALTKRDDKTKGFQFYAHDCEHSMLIDAVSPGIGIEENRVELNNMRVNDFSGFHPQWLHYKLSENAEYRLRFADRVQKHLFNNGAFTTDNCQKRFLSRAKEIEMAIIAESARWGDGTGGGIPKTKKNDWEPEINAVVNDYFPERFNIVLNQLSNADLFPSTNAPVFKINNSLLETPSYNFSDQIKVALTAEQTSSEIYLTTNGEDPRLVGGAINANALKLSNGNELDIDGTTWIKARIKRNNIWSPIRELRLIKVHEDYPSLRVTELYYHPSDSIINGDTVSGKSFEFLEIKNIGKHAVDLSRLFFDSGIDFQFEADAMLLPNKFFVVASSSKWFFERYGKVPSDVYKGNLSNEGEFIRLNSRENREVFAFQYAIENPWPSDLNGTGHSLSAVHSYPIGDFNDFAYWKKSTYLHGSPFYDDLGFPLYERDLISENNPISIYPNPVSDLLFIEVEEPTLFEIYTQTGQLIYRETLQQRTALPVHNLKVKSGLLLVKYSVNEKSEVRKILFRP